jgi:thioredoxin reductase (NADPH)
MQWFIFLRDSFKVPFPTTAGPMMHPGERRRRNLTPPERPAALDIGRTITLTDVVENYPGFVKLTGQELAPKMEEHARALPGGGNQDRLGEEHRSAGELLLCPYRRGGGGGHTLLFATGTRHRELAVPGHDEFRNKGVQYCALCDGPRIRVTRANVRMWSGSRVSSTLSELSSIGRWRTRRRSWHSMRSLSRSGSSRSPSWPWPLGVKTNRRGEIAIDRDSRTNVPGIYAAGDVADRAFKQAITGVAEGVIAAFGPCAGATAGH